MEEISLKYKYWTQEESPRYYARPGHVKVPNLDMEDMLADLVKRINVDKEKIYIKYPDDDEKRSGSIALVKKVTGDEFETKTYESHVNNMVYQDTASDYTFHLKWDDRKNTTKVRLRNGGWRTPSIVYLPDYKGPTVWTMFDEKEYIKKHKPVIRDRMKNKLAINDAVVYINARYGTGAYIELGVIRDIKYKVDIQYTGKKVVNPTVVVESIALTKNESPEMSKIRYPEQSILKMTDVDLFDEAFVRKLTVPQVPRK